MILNQERLTEIQGLLGDNFSSLIELFISDSKDQIEEISAWTDHSQNSSVFIAAHTLKSSAANLGLDQLSSQSDLIESACKDEKNVNISGLIAGISDLYNESISALEVATSIKSD